MIMVALALVPAPLPEETVLGYLMRFTVLGGHSGMKPVVQHLLGLTAIQPPWLVPSQLGALAEKLPTVFPSADDIVEKHTIYPALRPFLSLSDQTTVLAHMRGRESMKGIYALLGFVTAAVKTRNMQSFCLSCIRDDVERYGGAYWKRQHQFPHVTTCSVHGEPLVTGCGQCATSRRDGRTARLPAPRCWCGRSCEAITTPWRSENAQQADLRITTLLTRALAFPWPSFKSADLGALYRERVRAMGFARGRRIATTALHHAVVGHFSEELLEHYASPISLNGGWFGNVVNGRVPKSVLRHMLLIDFLFGSLEAFSATIQQFSRSALDAPSTNDRNSRDRLSRYAQGSAEFSQYRDRCRRRLRELLRKHADTTRTQALQIIGHTVAWLRNNDRHWYDEVLPALPKPGSQNAYKRSRQYRIAFDRKIRRQVIARYRYLVDPTTKPKRITRTLLLADQTRGHEIGTKSLALPRTEKLVQRLMETPIRHKERLALWILQHPEAVPPGRTALRHAYAATGLSQKRILELYTTQMVRGSQKRMRNPL